VKGWMKRRQAPSYAAGGADPRRKALHRAALAAMLAGILVTGLILTAGGDDPVAPPPPVPRALPATQPATPSSTAPAFQAAAQADAPSPQPLPVAEVAPSPAQAPVVAQLGAQPAVAAVAPVLLPVQSTVVAQPAGHVVQLGVFGAQENAERLRDALQQGGFAARTETRVVLGPYNDRAQAEAAQAALRKAGQQGGIVVAPRQP
jgi:cell division protein FtsN